MAKTYKYESRMNENNYYTYLLNKDLYTADFFLSIFKILYF